MSLPSHTGDGDHRRLRTVLEAVPRPPEVDETSEGNTPRDEAQSPYTRPEAPPSPGPHITSLARGTPSTARRQVTFHEPEGSRERPEGGGRYAHWRHDSGLRSSMFSERTSERSHCMSAEWVAVVDGGADVSLGASSMYSKFGTMRSGAASREWLTERERLEDEGVLEAPVRQGGGGPIALSPVDEIARLRSELSQMKASLESAQAAARSGLSRSADLREQLAEREAQLAQLRGSMKSSGAVPRDEEEEEGSSALPSDVAQLRREIAERDVTIAELREVIDLVRLQAKEQQRKSEGELTVAHKQAAQLQGLLHGRGEVVKDLERQVDELHSAAAEVEKENSRLVVELNGKWEVAKAEAQREKQKGEDLKARLSEEEERVRGLEANGEEVRILRDANKELQSELFALRKATDKGASGSSGSFGGGAGGSVSAAGIEALVASRVVEEKRKWKTEMEDEIENRAQEVARDRERAALSLSKKDAWSHAVDKEKIELQERCEAAERQVLDLQESLQSVEQLNGELNNRLLVLLQECEGLQKKQIEGLSLSRQQSRSPPPPQASPLQEHPVLPQSPPMIEPPTRPPGGGGALFQSLAFESPGALRATFPGAGLGFKESSAPSSPSPPNRSGISGRSAGLYASSSPYRSPGSPARPLSPSHKEDLRRKINGLQKRLAWQSAAHEEDIFTLESALSEERGRRTDLERQVQDLRGKLKARDLSRRTSRASFSSRSRFFSSEAAAAAAKLAAKAAQGTTSNPEELIETLRASEESLQEELEMVQKELEEKDSELTTLQGEAKEKDKLLESLKRGRDERVRTLESEALQLRARMGAMESEKEGLEREINELRLLLMDLNAKPSAGLTRNPLSVSMAQRGLSGGDEQTDSAGAGGAEGPSASASPYLPGSPTAGLPHGMPPVSRGAPATRGKLRSSGTKSPERWPSGGLAKSAGSPSPRRRLSASSGRGGSQQPFSGTSVLAAMGMSGVSPLNMSGGSANMGMSATNASLGSQIRAALGPQETLQGGALASSSEAGGEAETPPPPPMPMPFTLPGPGASPPPPTRLSVSTVHVQTETSSLPPTVSSRAVNTRVPMEDAHTQSEDKEEEQERDEKRRALEELAASLDELRGAALQLEAEKGELLERLEVLDGAEEKRSALETEAERLRGRVAVLEMELSETKKTDRVELQRKGEEVKKLEDQVKTLEEVKGRFEEKERILAQKERDSVSTSAQTDGPSSASSSSALAVRRESGSCVHLFPTQAPKVDAASQAGAYGRQESGAGSSSSASGRTPPPPSIISCPLCGFKSDGGGGGLGEDDGLVGSQRGGDVSGTPPDSGSSRSVHPVWAGRKSEEDMVEYFTDLLKEGGEGGREGGDFRRSKTSGSGRRTSGSAASVVGPTSLADRRRERQEQKALGRSRGDGSPSLSPAVSGSLSIGGGREEGVGGGGGPGRAPGSGAFLSLHESAAAASVQAELTEERRRSAEERARSDSLVQASLKSLEDEKNERAEEKRLREKAETELAELKEQTMQLEAELHAVRLEAASAVESLAASTAKKREAETALAETQREMAALHQETIALREERDRSAEAFATGSAALSTEAESRRLEAERLRGSLEKEKRENEDRAEEIRRSEEALAASESRVAVLEAEIVSMMHKCENLEESLKKEQAKATEMAAKDSEKEEISQSLATSRRHLAVSADKLEKEEERARLLEDKADQLEELCAELRGELEKERESAKQDAQALAAQTAAAREETEKMRVQLIDARHQLGEVETQREKEKEETAKQIQALEQTIEAAHKEQMAVAEELKVARVKAEAQEGLQREVVRLAGVMESLKQEAARKQQFIRERTRDLDTVRAAVQERSESAEEAMEALQKAKQDQEEMGEKLEKAIKRETELASRVAELEKRQEKLSGETDALVKSVRERAESTLSQKEAQLASALQAEAEAREALRKSESLLESVRQEGAAAVLRARRESEDLLEQQLEDTKELFERRLESERSSLRRDSEKVQKREQDLKDRVAILEAELQGERGEVARLRAEVEGYEATDGPLAEEIHQEVSSRYEPLIRDAREERDRALAALSEKEEARLAAEEQVDRLRNEVAARAEERRRVGEEKESGQGKEKESEAPVPSRLTRNNTGDSLEATPEEKVREREAKRAALNFSPPRRSSQGGPESQEEGKAAAEGGKTGEGEDVGVDSTDKGALAATVAVAAAAENQVLSLSRQLQRQASRLQSSLNETATLKSQLAEAKLAATELSAVREELETSEKQRKALVQQLQKAVRKAAEDAERQSQERADEETARLRKETSEAAREASADCVCALLDAFADAARRASGLAFKEGSSEGRRSSRDGGKVNGWVGKNVNRPSSAGSLRSSRAASLTGEETGGGETPAEILASQLKPIFGVSPIVAAIVSPGSRQSGGKTESEELLQQLFGASSANLGVSGMQQQKERPPLLSASSWLWGPPGGGSFRPRSSSSLGGRDGEASRTYAKAAASPSQQQQQIVPASVYRRASLFRGHSEVKRHLEGALVALRRAFASAVAKTREEAKASKKESAAACLALGLADAFRSRLQLRAAFALLQHQGRRGREALAGDGRRRGSRSPGGPAVSSHSHKKGTSSSGRRGEEMHEKSRSTQQQQHSKGARRHSQSLSGSQTDSDMPPPPPHVIESGTEGVDPRDVSASLRGSRKNFSSHPLPPDPNPQPLPSRSLRSTPPESLSPRQHPSERDHHHTRMPPSHMPTQASRTSRNSRAPTHTAGTQKSGGAAHSRPAGFSQGHTGSSIEDLAPPRLRHPSQHQHQSAGRLSSSHLRSPPSHSTADVGGRPRGRGTETAPSRRSASQSPGGPRPLRQSASGPLTPGSRGMRASAASASPPTVLRRVETSPSPVRMSSKDETNGRLGHSAPPPSVAKWRSQRDERAGCPVHREDAETEARSPSRREGGDEGGDGLAAEVDAALLNLSESIGKAIRERVGRAVGGAPRSSSPTTPPPPVGPRGMYSDRGARKGWWESPSPPRVSRAEDNLRHSRIASSYPPPSQPRTSAAPQSFASPPPGMARRPTADPFAVIPGGDGGVETDGDMEDGLLDNGPSPGTVRVRRLLTAQAGAQAARLAAARKGAGIGALQGDGGGGGSKSRSPGGKWGGLNRGDPSGHFSSTSKGVAEALLAGAAEREREREVAAARRQREQRTGGGGTRLVPYWDQGRIPLKVAPPSWSASSPSYRQRAPVGPDGSGPSLQVVSSSVHLDFQGTGGHFETLPAFPSGVGGPVGPPPQVGGRALQQAGGRESRPALTNRW